MEPGRELHGRRVACSVCSDGVHHERHLHRPLQHRRRDLVSEGQERLIQALIRGVITAILAALGSLAPFVASPDFSQALTDAGINPLFVGGVVSLVTGALALAAKWLGGVTVKPVLPTPGDQPMGAAPGTAAKAERPSILAI